MLAGGQGLSVEQGSRVTQDSQIAQALNQEINQYQTASRSMKDIQEEGTREHTSNQFSPTAAQINKDIDV